VSDPETHEIEAKVAAYLAHRVPTATSITISDFTRLPGGASQEMFRFHARWSENGKPVDRRLILRREPTAGLVEAERDLEFKIYQALAGSGLPLPNAHWLEPDGKWLDRPFFIMDMAPGKPGHPYMPGDPYEGHSENVARQFWHHLGQLTTFDHKSLGLQSLRGGDAADRFWSIELDHWETKLAENELVAEPVIRGARRHLRRNPPPEPAKPAIVHGDYRAGNFLFTPEDGQISAILDWEMAHIGDPLEDIAWAIDPMWPMTKYLPLEEGLAIWSAASGMAVDAQALDWWRLFSAFKASVLWLTAAKSFAEGKSKEMVLVMSAVNAGHIHRNVILNMMEARGAMA
jgi:aminoglycoside phosphotransferase (APT) family kinase protein